MADDPRLKYWQEADQNIRAANGMSLEDPEFWATLLIALVNATMAATPVELVTEVIARKQATQKRVQKATKRQLNRKP